LPGSGWQEVFASRPPDYRRFCAHSGRKKRTRFIAGAIKTLKEVVPKLKFPDNSITAGENNGKRFN
jgi:hypothetical protein